MFTGCRIGDAAHLGPSNIVKRNGEDWLEWQPEKRGSAPVSVPILHPLARSIEALTVTGPTFILTAAGRPFASKAALGGRFRDWCNKAGLERRSAHGIRKALSELLAESGATQHMIMSIMGHTQAKTSEVYTKGVNRAILASEGMALMKGLDW